MSSDQQAGEAQRRLLREIEDEVNQLARECGTPPLDPRVRLALGKIPRQEFIDPGCARAAYANCPLAIGHGQTISQPFIVAFMTNLLQIDENSIVLEIGTGSGYQAAVLAELARQVYTIEIIEDLAVQATQRLLRLGYDNVQVRHGDGYHGWKENSPFDAVIITAAAPDIPPPLVEQLNAAGRLVAPVDHHFRGQNLVLVHKDAAGRPQRRNVLPVAFVPLTRYER